MFNKNAAYDFSLFENKKKQVKENVVKLPKSKKKFALKARSVMFLGVVMCMVAFGGVVATFINSQVQLNELTEQIAKASKELEESKSQYTQLSMKKEEQMSTGAVERKAKEDFGMKKIDASQKEYINVSRGDKAEIKK